MRDVERRIQKAEKQNDVDPTFVEQGARLDLTNDDNQTPLDLARARRVGDSTVALRRRLGAGE